MRSFFVIFTGILLSQQCTTLPVEDTVVSVYTTHPTTMGTNPPIDVYHQIANNIAERITNPIYKFLGINDTKSEGPAKPGKIELQDDQDLSTRRDMKPIDNDISKERDVEELSVEALKKKSDKKPEKITLYSSYLPVAKASEVSSRQEIETSTDSTTNDEIDDSFDWDDEEVVKPKEGPFIFLLEFFGSMIQLVWGGLVALFTPKSRSN